MSGVCTLLSGLNEPLALSGLERPKQGKGRVIISKEVVVEGPYKEVEERVVWSVGGCLSGEVALCLHNVGTVTVCRTSRSCCTLSLTKMMCSLGAGGSIRSGFGRFMSELVCGRALVLGRVLASPSCREESFAVLSCFATLVGYRGTGSRHSPRDCV